MCLQQPCKNCKILGIECIWIGLRLVNTKLIVIGVIYRPPSGKVEKFVEVVEDICLSLRSQRNCEINFGGDINLDFNKRNPDVKKYKDSLKRMGLSQTISDITHVSDSRMHVSTIDHFVTSDLYLYSKTGVIPHGATDHFMIFATHKKPHVKYDNDRYYGRSYGKMNKLNFSYEVITTDWDGVYEELNPEEAWLKFKTIFVNILDNHAPYKYFNSKKDRQPWVTTEFLEAGNERDEKQKVASQSLDPSDKIEYKRTRNRVTSLKRELKRIFFKNSTDKAGNDQQKLWKALKRFLQNSSPSNRILNINGETDAEKMACAINDYFADIGVKSSDKIGNSRLNLNFESNPDIP